MKVGATGMLMVFAALVVRADVTFGPVKNYPNLGFMMPILERALAEPLPMARARAFLLTGGGALAREDRFDPYELWYGSQCCGRWRDQAGNRLILGCVAQRLPVFDDDLVSRETFGLRMRDAANEVNVRERAQVNEWVATFAGVPVYEPEALKLNRFALEEVLAYPCGEAGTLVYAFRPRRVGNAPSHGWFAVVFHAVGAPDAAALRKTFEEGFVAALAQPSRLNKEDGAEAAEVSVLRTGEKAPDLPNHPVRVEARRSVENYEDWWFAETDGYIILSDVHTEVGKSLINELKETLPALRRAYERLVPPLTREPEVALLRLFAGRDDYVRHVGEDHAWSSGMWMPARRELVLFAQANRETMMQIIRHEAFHQYLSYATCMLGAAPWLNEGHACLFENAQVDKKGHVTLPEDPERTLVLLENLETAVALLPFLLQTDYEAFYDGTSAGRRLKYAMAWGLAYYLHKGVPLERDPPHARGLDDYLEALSVTRDPYAATSLAFAEVEMDAFQAAFRDFWLRRRDEAQRVDPLE
ncbi:MAG TPA: hypothetical protein P5026_08535 [Kiritimatiellia bacterium]|nr:hypothetical protein [Kiritimatiellia bacterium]HRU70981.1 hypothetical protein [Kiritimatiellia bacterium]